MVRGKSGKWIAVHPSYKLAGDIWSDLPNAEIKKIHEERAAFKKSRSTNDSATVVSQLTTDSNGMATIQVPISMIQQATSTQEEKQEPSDNGNTNPMGGRNEQAQLRSRNGGRS